MWTNIDLMRTFLDELMRRHNRLPSQLAADLNVSHATVGRWLSGEDVPSTKSCQKLAEYSGLSLERVLSIAGHLPVKLNEEPIKWPKKHGQLHQVRV